jgi:uncharacterized protein
VFFVTVVVYGLSVAERIILRGRKVVGGRAEGEALVTRDTVPGWGGVNPVQGVITETRHDLRGVSFKNKVLVCRGAKGSSGWSAMYHTARLAGTAPLALVFNEMTTKIALGAVVMRVPSVTDLDRDPLDVIQTGDWVVVDGDRGVVEIEKRRTENEKRATDNEPRATEGAISPASPDPLTPDRSTPPAASAHAMPERLRLPLHRTDPARCPPERPVPS